MTVLHLYGVALMFWLFAPHARQYALCPFRRLGPLKPWGSLKCPLPPNENRPRDDTTPRQCLVGWVQWKILPIRQVKTRSSVPLVRGEVPGGVWGLGGGVMGVGMPSTLVGIGVESIGLIR
jgi:hypothetical protein